MSIFARRAYHTHSRTHGNEFFTSAAYRQKQWTWPHVCLRLVRAFLRPETDVLQPFPSIPHPQALHQTTLSYRKKTFWLLLQGPSFSTAGVSEANAALKAKGVAEPCMHAKSATTTFPYTYPSATSLSLVSYISVIVLEVPCVVAAASHRVVLCPIPQQFWRQRLPRGVVHHQCNDHDFL